MLNRICSRAWYLESRFTAVAGLALLLAFNAEIHGQEPARTLSSTEREAALTEMAERIATSYIDETLGRQMAAHVVDAKHRGSYEPFTNGEAFAQHVTADLREICHDGHLRVRFQADPRQVMPSWNEPAPDDVARFKRAAAFSNYGFVRVKRVAGHDALASLRRGAR